MVVEVTGTMIDHVLSLVYVNLVDLLRYEEEEATTISMEYRSLTAFLLEAYLATGASMSACIDTITEDLRDIHRVHIDNPIAEEEEY